MPARASLIVRVLLLMAAVSVTVAGDACFNVPPPPAEIAAPAPTPMPEVTENPEAEETPETWPVAPLTEQDITPEATSTPSPTETATPTETPYGQTPAPTSTPSPTPTESPTPTPTPVPTPQPDFSQNLPSGQLSDQPLDAEIKAATTPTRKTAIRIVDRARRDLLKHHPDEAIRTLTPALSIDAGNPYVYFYLGRAYLMKHNYSQALTFWERAAIGFADNPPWLSEALSFEGGAKERLGDTEEARSNYQRALKLAPDNQLARDGYARVGPPPPPPPAEPSGEPPEQAQPPPEEAVPPPPPAATEPPPAEEEPLPAEVPTPENF
jgi:hypothetical protein